MPQILHNHFWKISNSFLKPHINLLSVDYEQLSELENKEFGDLCEMPVEFSDDEKELKIPNMFFSEEKILNFPNIDIFLSL